MSDAVTNCSNQALTVMILLAYTLGYVWAKYPNTGNSAFEFLRFVALGAIIAAMLYRG